MIRYTSLLLLVIVALSSAVSTTSAAVDHKVVDRLLTQLEELNDNKKSSTDDKNSRDIKMLTELHRLLTDIEKLNDSRKLPGDDDKEDDKKDEKKDDDKKKEDEKKGDKDEQENDVNGITEGGNGASSSSSYQVVAMFAFVASSAVGAMLF